jgi:hypothetical protein
MKYTILIHETPIELGARTDQRRQPAYWGAYRAYTLALEEAGIMVGGSALQAPPVATTVRQPAGRPGRLA